MSGAKFYEMTQKAARQAISYSQLLVCCARHTAALHNHRANTDLNISIRRESGGDYSNTFSKSRTLKDASQQSTASHTIPKVTGEVRTGRQTLSSTTALPSRCVCEHSGQGRLCRSHAAVADHR